MLRVIGSKPRLVTCSRRVADRIVLKWKSSLLLSTDRNDRAPLSSARFSALEVRSSHQSILHLIPPSINQDSRKASKSLGRSIVEMTFHKDTTFGKFPVNLVAENFITTALSPPTLEQHRRRMRRGENPLIKLISSNGNLVEAVAPRTRTCESLTTMRTGMRTIHPQPT